ncbi:S8 family peptidase [Pseudogracilibacillus sp. ICA-222130]|uniref:S8 family peptidase n=1 Tax=Pseudogracilibacillus sp. ICA-222130 TaxID=3134655 RepID=UPI0030C36C78
MRKWITMLIIITLCFTFVDNFETVAEEKSVYIVEVTTSPKKTAQYIKRHHPTMEVMETFDILLQAVAVKGTKEELEKLQQEPFIQTIHQNQQYKAVYETLPNKNALQNAYIPAHFNGTKYTGKGIKIGIIDTGIDLEHEALTDNFQGGSDVVEYNDEPAETEEGFGQTIHGTHVAGIVGANGKIKGVAPESDIYAYRALGPNGFGTSVQVIAAMEKALEDGVDILNLSLGNTINVPDFPTSKAVNKATEHGVMVVVANGNDGPNDWTIGAPATAPTAISVGAYKHPMKEVSLWNARTKEKTAIFPVEDVDFWQTETTYYISETINHTDLLLINEANKTVLEDIESAKVLPKGIIVEAALYDESFFANYDIPVAIVESADKLRQKERMFFHVKTETTKEDVAPFSSRGPVAMNWQMKPDLLAPGVQIVSTIPGGYDMLNGTSMAAPHIAGAVAILKEAQPTWTNEQIIGALKTTARKLENKRPIEQGAGLVQIEEAIQTDVIINDPLLSFGKIHRFMDERTIELEIENIGKEAETFRFHIPKKEKGVTWHLPMNFTIGPNEKKTIPIKLKMNRSQIEDGIYEGYITLQSKKALYELPYMYMLNETKQKKIDGFQIKERPSTSEEHKYEFEFYATEMLEKVDVFLFDTENYVLEEKIATFDELQIGKKEGTFQLQNDEIILTNRFVFVFAIQLQGDKIIYETIDNKG